MSEIICDTSPLQYLHQLGQLDLLPSLVGKVIVAAAVVEELEAGRALKLDLPDVSSLEWIVVRTPAGGEHAVSWPGLGRGRRTRCDWRSKQRRARRS